MPTAFLLPLLLLLLTALMATAAAATTPFCVCRPSDSSYATTASGYVSVAHTDPIESTVQPTTVTGTRTVANATLRDILDEIAYSASTSGYSRDQNTDIFTVPNGASGDVFLAVDLQIGSTNANFCGMLTFVCRSAPQVTQICVSSDCANCSLRKFSAFTKNALSDTSTQFIFIHKTLSASQTVCTDSATLASHGSFRFVQIFPEKLTVADDSNHFSFKLMMSGNFPAYSCPNVMCRRRRSADQGQEWLALRLARRRRAVPTDCSCPVGEQPVFSASRTVQLRWKYPKRSYNSRMADRGTNEYKALASETYYIVTVAVRNSPRSNLSSILGDIFNIAFSSDVEAPLGVLVSAFAAVRNDRLFADSFIAGQLAAILPGYGVNITQLTVVGDRRPVSRGPEATTAVPPGIGGQDRAAGSHAFAVVHFCVLLSLALTVGQF